MHGAKQNTAEVRNVKWKSSKCQRRTRFSPPEREAEHLDVKTVHSLRSEEQMPDPQRNPFALLQNHVPDFCLWRTRTIQIKFLYHFQRFSITLRLFKLFKHIVTTAFPKPVRWRVISTHFPAKWWWCHFYGWSPEQIAVPEGICLLLLWMCFEKKMGCITALLSVKCLNIFTLMHNCYTGCQKWSLAWCFLNGWLLMDSS